MSARPSVRTTLAIAASAVMFSCCGSRTSEIDHVEDAIDFTIDAPYRLESDETTALRSVSVAVDVEDDLRYAARLDVDDEPVYEEVASEDVLAARLLAPVGLEIMAREPTGSATELLPGGWVQDQVGAPDVLAPPSLDPRLRRRAGDDPILDALGVLASTRKALRQSTLSRFDPDSLRYRPDEDPFPHPEREKGETRYDVAPLPISRAQGNGDPAAQVSVANLRKLSVYVRDGRVVSIRREVSMEPYLRDLESKLGLELPTDAPPGERARVALALINISQTAMGNEEIRPETVEVRIERSSTQVTLPADAPIASLKALRNRGSESGSVPPLKTADERPT